MVPGSTFVIVFKASGDRPHFLVLAGFVALVELGRVALGLALRRLALLRRFVGMATPLTFRAGRVTDKDRHRTRVPIRSRHQIGPRVEGLLPIFRLR